MRTAFFVLMVFSAVAAVLVTACGDDQAPAGSAPANVIAFGAREGEGRHGLYLVNPDGADPRRLTEERGFIFFPRWSPTGDSIAYIVGAEDEERPGDLLVYDFTTETKTLVSSQAVPSLLGPATGWSPDGRRLAFSEAGDGGRVRIFDIGRGELIDFPEVSGATPDWSPDGSEIVFTRPAATPPEADLYVMDSDGDNIRVFLERSGVEGNPRWSPEGERLAFWAAPAGRPETRSVVIVNREGGQAIDVSPGFAAAWSPDAGRVSYTGPPATGSPADLDILLADVAGNQPRVLSGGVTVDVWPSWSPSGEKLVYLAQADRRTAFLCVVSIAQLSDECLDLPAGLVPAAPDWSPR